jgi:O-antigen/teichoic acid export membrane protein
LNALISSLMFPYSQGLFSLERAKADTLVNLVTVALLFTIGIAAVEYYSTLGAAVALAVSSGIAALIRARVFAREIRQDRTTTPSALRERRATT